MSVPFKNIILIMNEMTYVVLLFYYFNSWYVIPEQQIPNLVKNNV